MSEKKSMMNRIGLGWLLDLCHALFLNRLLLALLSISLIPLTVLGLSMYYLASTAIMKQATDRLTAVRTIKANQIQGYFRGIQDRSA